MAKAGYYRLYRKIEDHWLWPANRKFTELEAWLDLMNQAAYIPHKSTHNGKVLLLDVGEIATSERKLAKRWGWNERTVGRFLKRLENDAMLYSTEWGTKYGRLKLTNYADLQDKSEKNAAQNTAQDTAVSTAESTAHSTADPSWNPFQGEAEKPPIIKGNKGKEKNTNTTAEAVVGKPKSKANKQPISSEARQIVKYLSDSLKQRGGREGQFDQSWAFAGFNAAEKLLKSFKVSELETAIDYLLDHKYHGTGITSMSAVANKILVWQREVGVPATGQMDVFEDPLSRGCK